MESTHLQFETIDENNERKTCFICLRKYYDDNRFNKNLPNVIFVKDIQNNTHKCKHNPLCVLNIHKHKYK